MARHSLINLKFQQYYENEDQFSGVYMEINLPKNGYIINGTYNINVYEYIIF